MFTIDNTLQETDTIVHVYICSYIVILLLMSIVCVLRNETNTEIENIGEILIALFQNSLLKLMP